MLEPTSMEEYSQRQSAHTSITGYGLDVTQHLPCPFCGGPDFAVHRVLEMEDTLSQPHVCKHCGRGAKCVFQSVGHGLVFELVQTSGPMAPLWLQPPIRRLP